MEKKWYIIIAVVLIFVAAAGFRNDSFSSSDSQSEIDERIANLEGYEELVKETEKLNQEKGVELTPYQYYITQKSGTERPFDNEFWDNKEEGIYVDVVTGEPLFSSLDKYDSGTGWPSFTRPLDEEMIVEEEDNTLAVTRTEVKSASGTHLGHVFDDGPVEAGGERFCINSASLRFVPKDDLEAEGYGEYLGIFEKE